MGTLDLAQAKHYFIKLPYRWRETGHAPMEAWAAEAIGRDLAELASDSSLSTEHFSLNARISTHGLKLLYSRSH